MDSLRWTAEAGRIWWRRGRQLTSSNMNNLFLHAARVRWRHLAAGLLAVFSPVSKAQTVLAWGSNPYGQATMPAGLENVTSVSAGWDFSTALRSDGTVVAWGRNDSSQSTVPTGLSGVAGIASGHYHTLGLKTDGTVVSWGAYTSVPSSLNAVTAISAGLHSLALKADGTVAAWGNNESGQTTVPAGLSGVIAVAAGESHSLALKADGSVAGWGLNTQGQITIPAGLGPVKAIAAGAFHSLALKTDGTVAVWGLNTFGQLNIPAGTTEVIAVRAGAHHSFALKADGSVVTWGRNIPGTLALPVNFSAASSLGGGVLHSLALVPQETVTSEPYFISAAAVTAARGFALHHQVLAARRTLPFVVTGMPEWLSFDAGSGLLTGTPPQTGTWSMVVTAQNAAGPVSQTLTLHVNQPVPLITSSTEVTAWGVAPFSYRITAGNSPATFSATGLPPGLTLDTATGWITGAPLAVNDFPVTIGAVNPWGESSATLMLRVRAVASFGYPHDPVATVPPGMAGLVEISEYSGHVLARRADGTVTGWGANGYGQINIPPGLNDVTAVAAGGSVSLALKRDGTVVEWGGTSQSPMPAGLTDVVAIAAGDTLRMALKRDGTVVSWGEEEFDVPRPPGLSHVTAIAAGDYHSMALRADGTLAGWGFSSIVRPTIVTPLQNVVAVTASGWYTTAVLADGTLRSWGGESRNWLWQVPDVLSVTTGNGTVLALKTDGSISGWLDGFNYGQTIPPADFGPAAAVATGFYHSTALTATEPGVPQPMLMNSCFAMGGVQHPFTWRIRARNLPQSYAAAGLPPGLHVDAATGVISGLPQQAGDFPATISATNNAGTAEMAVRFTILSTPAPALHHAAAVTGYCGNPFNFQLLSNHTAGTWTATGLPPGLSLNGDTGLISGTPTTEGLHSVAVTSINPYGTVTGTLLLTTSAIAAWGANEAGQSSIPAGLTEVIALAGGTAHSLALRRNGTVAAWGSSTGGALDVPPELTDVGAIYARGTNNLALRKDGTLVAWGTTPAVPPGLYAGTAAAALGAAHALALKRDGTVVAWGDDTFGQCQVPPGLSGVVAVAAGDFFSIALKADGTLTAWGKNTEGQSTVPAGLSGVTAIACNADNTAWLKSDGSTGVFGRNPPASSPSNVQQIAAAGDHYLALVSGGSLYRWGAATGVAALPVGMSKAAAIAGGQRHALALTPLDPSTALPIILNPPFVLGRASALFGTRILTRNAATSYAATGLPSGISINTTTGVVSGQAFFAGSYAVTLQATNAAGTTSKSLTLTINGTSATYLQWTRGYFTPAELANPAISGGSADPDSDGLPNRMEAVFGSSPKLPGTHSSGFVPVPGGTASDPVMACDLTLASQLPINLSCRVEVSDSLTADSWTTIAERPGLGSWTGSAVVTQFSDRTVVRCTDTAALPGAARRYLRFTVAGG